MRHTRAIVVGLVLSLALSGCSALDEFVPPGTFNYVNEAVDELELDTVGEFEAEGSYGGQWPMGSGPTCVAVISGGNAPDLVTERLVELGYEHVGRVENIESWERGSDDTFLQVHVIQVQPGDLATIRDGEDIVVEREGLYLTVTN